MVAKQTESSEPTQATLPVETPEVPDVETRVDEHAIDQFAALGYTGRLPDVLVETYNAYKKMKDRVHAGPMSPEGIVNILFFAGLVNKDL